MAARTSSAAPSCPSETLSPARSSATPHSGPELPPMASVTVSEAARRTACASPVGGSAASAAAPRARVVPKSPSPATSSRRSNSSRSRSATPAMVRSSWSMVSEFWVIDVRYARLGTTQFPSETPSTFVTLMDQPTLMPEHLLVRDLQDGQVVDSVYEVRAVTRRQKKNGEEFLKLQLGDVSGAVEAVAWEDVEQIAAEALLGTAVRVFARYSCDQRYGSTLTVRRLRAAQPEEFDPDQLSEGPPIPYEQMVGDLENLIGTVQNPYLRELLDRLLGGRHRDRRPLARGARRQDLPPGLPPRAARALALGRPGRQRDGRDLPRHRPRRGRHRARCCTTSGRSRPTSRRAAPSTCRTPGKLQGEIPLGYYRVRSTDGGHRRLPARPGHGGRPHRALSHHGKLEHGSPVTPCTREATLVHMIDNLGGTLGTFDRIEKSLAEGEQWSGYDRALSGSAYFSASRAA